MAAELVTNTRRVVGDEFESPATLPVRLIGTAPLASAATVNDGKQVYSTHPNTREVNGPASAANINSTCSDSVHGEQADAISSGPADVHHHQIGGQEAIVAFGRGMCPWLNLGSGCAILREPQEDYGESHRFRGRQSRGSNPNRSE